MAPKVKKAQPANPFKEQYVASMKASWAWIDAHYNALELWGEPGEQMVLWQSALRCHGDLPIGTGLLALAAAASNGATSPIFGDKPTPLFFWGINSNYPQTRKSELCKMLTDGADHLNTLISQDLLVKWEAAVAEAGQRRVAGIEHLGQPCLESIEIPNSTITEVFNRLSADWPMVRNFDESGMRALGLMKTNSRVWYGMLINDDEFYNKANELNLLTSDSHKLSDVNDHQSTLNLFVTTDRVKRTTKTAGSLGMTTSNTVTAGGCSNMHPSLSVPFQNKDIGQHVAACYDRFALITQEFLQPHADLPLHLQLDGAVPRHRWVPLSPEDLRDLKLHEKCQNPQEHFEVVDGEAECGSPVRRRLRRAVVEDAAADAGWTIYAAWLEDNKMVRLAHNGSDWRLRIANRRLRAHLPPRYSIPAFVKKIFDYFKDRPNSEVGWSDRAQEIFDVRCVVQNVKAYVARMHDEDPDAAAADAIGPLKIGVLAPLLAIFDLGCGVYEEARQDANWRLEVGADHIRRATALFHLIDGFAKAHAPAEAPSPPSLPPLEPPVAEVPPASSWPPLEPPVAEAPSASSLPPLVPPAAEAPSAKRLPYSGPLVATQSAETGYKDPSGTPVQGSTHLVQGQFSSRLGAFSSRLGTFCSKLGTFSSRLK